MTSRTVEEPLLGQVATLKDLVLPAAVLAVVGMMMFPLPSALLDSLLICNIIFALALLLNSVYLSEPERFTALPTVLLLSTLFRLGLNVSTTRQLLGTGQAPDTVVTFGNLLLDGNIVVGAVIFCIITLVQFVVIAKGAERVAEVAARFTLDAMPGKQMAIDADIRSGLLSLVEAKAKRLALQRESKLYGALDGAMKFVKGDAIAGICITLVNIVGGFIVGVTQQSLSLAEAAQRYTLYTVGDGLVSQIPALLVAIAAGIAVTRVSDEHCSFVGREVFTQLTREPQALMATAGVSGILMFVPGLPVAPFMVIALVVLFIAVQVKGEHSLLQKKQNEVTFRPRILSDVLLRIPVKLVELLQQDGTLAQRVQMLRNQIFESIGILVPDVQFEILPEGSPDEVSLCLRGVEEVKFAPSYELSPGQITTELLASISKFLWDFRCEFCDDSHTRVVLEIHRATCEELINAVVPDSLTITELTAILRELVREEVSIRSLSLIMQALAEFSVQNEKGSLSDLENCLGSEKRGENLKLLGSGDGSQQKTNALEMLAAVRVALSRVITSGALNSDGKVSCWLIDSELDHLIASSQFAGMQLEPEIIKNLRQELATRVADVSGNGRPVILCSKQARLRLARVVANGGILARVIATDELISTVPLEIKGKIGTFLSNNKTSAASSQGEPVAISGKSREQKRVKRLVDRDSQPLIAA